MATVPVQVPDDLLALLEQSRLPGRTQDDRVRVALALQLFQQGVISIGKAVDDRRARDEAARLGLPHTGTVGLLRLARDRGLIDVAYPILLELRRRNFWISDGLLERIADEER